MTSQAPQHLDCAHLATEYAAFPYGIGSMTPCVPDRRIIDVGAPNVRYYYKIALCMKAIAHVTSHEIGAAHRSPRNCAQGDEQYKAAAVACSRRRWI